MLLVLVEGMSGAGLFYSLSFGTLLRRLRCLGAPETRFVGSLQLLQPFQDLIDLCLVALVKLPTRRSLLELPVLAGARWSRSFVLIILSFSHTVEPIWGSPPVFARRLIPTP